MIATETMAAGNADRIGFLATSTVESKAEIEFVASNTMDPKARNDADRMICRNKHGSAQKADGESPSSSVRLFLGAAWSWSST